MHYSSYALTPLALCSPHRPKDGKVHVTPFLVRKNGSLIGPSTELSPTDVLLVNTLYPLP
jgi:hypothetical protein